MRDIDPRESELSNCFTISDKARSIAGSVLEAVSAFEHGEMRSILEVGSEQLLLNNR